MTVEQTLANHTVAIDIAACNGCGICAEVCPVDRGRLWLFAKNQQGQLQPRGVCLQCTPAACMESCPNLNIYRDAAGIVRVHEDACNCCGICTDACRYGAILVDWAKAKWSTVKCDLCSGAPECVEACPTGALFLDRVPDRIKVQR